MQSFSNTWLELLKTIMDDGSEVSPRGMKTLELPQHTIKVNMRKPVLTVPSRKLNYKFMAAEAYWILSGDDKVENIAPYNSKIAQFSDNGKTFFGAYGPKIISQLTYVINKLIVDKDSRQAGLTIWRENPEETKDVPCTVAIFFNIRQVEGKDLLNVHVFMRSSDAWLGVPYDVFNFCMLGHFICGYLNALEGSVIVSPGTMYLTAASSHLYETNWSLVQDCLSNSSDMVDQPETPVCIFATPGVLMQWLKNLRETSPGDYLRWWEGPKQ